MRLISAEQLHHSHHEADLRMRTKRRPQSYHHGDLKNALMDTALDQVTKHGAGALSLREVARRTGVSHTASYRHFPSKESLLAAIAEQGFRRLNASTRVAISRFREDPVSALQAAGVAYVEFAVAHPEHFTIMFSGEINHHNYEGLAEASNEAYTLLRSIVQQGLQGENLRGDDEGEVTLAAWSMVHGLAHLLVAGRRLRARGVHRSSTPDTARSVISMLLEGIVVAVPVTANEQSRATSGKRAQRSSQ
jgi:AcrR family transcriptional regulator